MIRCKLGSSTFDFWGVLYPFVMAAWGAWGPLVTPPEVIFVTAAYGPFMPFRHSLWKSFVAACHGGLGLFCNGGLGHSRNGASGLYHVLPKGAWAPTRMASGALV